MLKMAAQFCSMGKTSHAHIQSIIAYEGNSLYGSTQVNTICYDGMRMCEWVCMRYLLYIYLSWLNGQKGAVYMCAILFSPIRISVHRSNLVAFSPTFLYYIILYFFYSVFVCRFVYLSLALSIAFVLYLPHISSFVAHWWCASQSASRTTKQWMCALHYFFEKAVSLMVAQIKINIRDYPQFSTIPI